MRTLLMSAVCGLTLLTACGKQNDDGTASADAAKAATKYAAVDEARLLAANEPANAGQWMSYGRDYEEQRFSPLKSINTDTVKDLGLAWYGDFDTRRGQESTPIVVDGVIYVTTAWSKIYAYEAKTGKQLWQFQTGSGINAMPVTYTHKGRQYVTVLSGIGGLYWNINREALKSVPQGGSVWTFALLPD